MLYAVTEIAVFMVAATIVGFMIGRVTKRSKRPVIASGDNGDVAELETQVAELTSERSALKDQLRDAKDRVRQLAAETTVDEQTEDFAEEKKRLESALEEAEAQADRLRSTIAERDTRIASLTSGEELPQEAPAGSVGYSSSAGTLADTRIVFGEEDDS